jgi:sugar O-acyltransferase (sialic acid O-acetyltransferase NeuD family)
MSRRSYDLAVFGGGGHAAVLIEAALAQHSSWHIAVFEPRPVPELAAVSSQLSFVGDDDAASEVFSKNPSMRFAVGLGVVGEASRRVRLYDYGISIGMRPVSIVHPSAVVAPSARIEDGAQVFAGAIVNTRALIETNAIVNTRAVVEHDCRVGAHAHVASGACLCGDVTMGEASFVGAASVVIQGVEVSEHSTIGAGSVVIRNVPPWARVAGAPAKPLSGRVRQP